MSLKREGFAFKNYSQKKRLALNKARKGGLRNAQADERAGSPHLESTGLRP